MSVSESPSEAAKELLRRQAARRNIAPFIDLLGLGFKPAKHHEYVIQKLEAVERGEINRLMVFMPPGSAKSTYGSIIFPSWYFGRNPDKFVIHVSHTTELAEKWGRRIRNLINDPVYQRQSGAGGRSTCDDLTPLD